MVHLMIKRKPPKRNLSAPDLFRRESMLGLSSSDLRPALVTCLLTPRQQPGTAGNAIDEDPERWDGLS